MSGVRGKVIIITGIIFGVEAREQLLYIERGKKVAVCSSYKENTGLEGRRGGKGKQSLHGFKHSSLEKKRQVKGMMKLAGVKCCERNWKKIINKTEH